MHADALDYRLPPELIAQHAAEPRDSARLLVYDRRDGAVRHRRFRDLPAELDPADLIVVNDTRVLPVRVRARRESGGAAEVLLLEPRGDAGDWEALVRPYRRLRIGETLRTAGISRSRSWSGSARAGRWCAPAAPSSLEAALERVGEMPLPPYIGAPLDDRSRYQTVYARAAGSAAAPTAGLHFTTRLWQEMRARHDVRPITLDVGLDTFRPLSDRRSSSSTRSIRSATTSRLRRRTPSHARSRPAGASSRSAPPPCACWRRCSASRVHRWRGARGS